MPRLFRWRYCTALLIFATASMALLPTLQASVVRHGTLKRAAEVAELIFAGSVDSTVTEFLSGHVVTHVHFSKLRIAKGRHAGPTLTLHMAGGRYNGKIYWTNGQPEFVIGQRYIVMIEKDFGSIENLYLPILGLYQGFYPLSLDTTSSRVVVHDWTGKPITAVSGGHIISVDKSKRKPSPTIPSPTSGEPPFEVIYADEDPGTRLTEAAFLEVIRRFASREK